MPRFDSAKPPISAEARRWWPAPIAEARELGGRSELEPSGVLLRFAEVTGVLLRLAAMWLLDMAKDHDTVASLLVVVGEWCRCKCR